MLVDYFGEILKNPEFHSRALAAAGFISLQLRQINAANKNGNL